MSCNEEVISTQSRSRVYLERNKRTYVETVITGLGNLGQCANGADLGLFFFLFLVGHVDETFFESDGEGDERISRVMLVDPGLDLW